MSKLKLSVVVVVLIGLIYAAIATAHSGDGRATVAASPATSTAASGPDAFAVFRRPEGAGDAMPAEARRELGATAARTGVNLDDARAVAASGVGEVWAIPGPQQICIAEPDPIDGFAVNCAAIDQVAGGTLWTGLNGLPGQVAGDALVAIMVPDGVRDVTAVATDGSTQRVAVRDNVAFAALAKSASITFQDGNETRSVVVPGTPPALVAKG